MAASRLAASFLAVPALIGLAIASVAPAQGADGLTVNVSPWTWPRWQARLQLLDAPVTRWSLGERLEFAPPVRAALLGDYDLGTFGIDLPFAQGRFRATSGLLFGLRPGAAGIDLSAPSMPYLGLGWSGGLPKTGLSFSADLGLAAETGGLGWRWTGARLGAQGFDGNWRDLRLQPRLQLGVQYQY
jgi:hypothetical protein